MSQPFLLVADSQAIQDLQDEIEFQKVLLSTLDDSVQQRETAERDIKDEIKALEREILKLKQGATALSSTALSQPQKAPSSHLNPSASFLSASKNSMVAMDHFSGQEQLNPFRSLSSTASTPNSGDASDSLSPSRVSLPTRKRSYSKHLENVHLTSDNNKSRRTSPSPYMTGLSSTLSSGDDDFPEFGSKLFAQKQKKIVERIEQVKRDEEVARQMQQQFQTPFIGPLPTARPSTTGLSAFDMISGARRSQSITGKNSALAQQQPHYSERVLPQVSTGFTSSISNKSSSMLPKIKHEGTNSMNQNYNQLSLKPGVSPTRRMPGAFGSDLSDSNDSDIEIIPASAFHDNGRHSRQVSRPSFTPEAQATSQVALQRIKQSQSNSNNAFQQSLFRRNSPAPGWIQTTGVSLSPPDTFYETGNTFSSIIGDNHVYSRTLHNGGSSNAFTNFDQLISGAGVYQNGRPSESLNGPQLDYASSNSLRTGQLIDMTYQPGGGNFNEFEDYLNLGESSMGHVEYTMNDSRNTTQEIKELLENIRPDVELPPEDREGTPEGLFCNLLEHQKLALTWLKSMEESTNKGGILADDMGLGKTISTIALMLSRPSSDRNRKTTLIVGPVALIRQWNLELKEKISRSHRFSVHMVHGGGKKLNWDELKVYDVVLTTYGTLASEWRRYEKWIIQAKDNANGGEYDQRPCNKLFPMLGPKSLFYRVVLDEAQSIKNRTTVSAQACCRLKAIYRWCLSGTPMQNNCSELYSLIHFLRIKPYNEHKKFQNEFGMLTKGNYSKHNVTAAMRKLQAVLKAILLRRTKTSLIDGKPIINLPPKTEEVQHVVFDEDEQAFYTSLESKTQIQFNKYVKNGTAGKNYSNILVLLLRLRQACCHPHLLHDFQESPSGVDDPSAQAMMELTRNLSLDVVARLIGQEAFECPVCYDAILNPRIITPCGHDTCAECLIKISDQAARQNIRDGNDDNRGLKCPSCRGDLALDKVIDYATFKRVHNPDLDPVDDDITTGNSSEDSNISESEDNANSDGDLRNFIVPDGASSEDNSSEVEDGDDEAEESKKAVLKLESNKPETRRRKKKSNREKEKKPHLSLAMLKREANKNVKNRKRYLKYLKKNWQPSAKITKCVSLLETFLEDGQKTIIFSQFVSLLDLLEVPINEKKWDCLRYDGSQSADARNDAVNKFRNSPTHNIMLISLKAGNAGLNLTAASRVIILDPFWNPFIEMQAVDRAYRIGQQRPVQVHRILIEGTVEDRIIELQEQKRTMVNAALDEGANKDIGRLDLGQLAFLFGVSH